MRNKNSATNMALFDRRIEAMQALNRILLAKITSSAEVLPWGKYFYVRCDSNKILCKDGKLR